MLTICYRSNVESKVRYCTGFVPIILAGHQVFQEFREEKAYFQFGLIRKKKIFMESLGLENDTYQIVLSYFSTSMAGFSFVVVVVCLVSSFSFFRCPLHVGVP